VGDREPWEIERLFALLGYFSLLPLAIAAARNETYISASLEVMFLIAS
jgi:hypothetical protein